MYSHETAIKALQEHDRACMFQPPHISPCWYADKDKPRTIRLCSCGQQATLGDYCGDCAEYIPE